MPLPDEVDHSRDKLRAAFVEESPLANMATKSALAETLAALVVRQRILFMRDAENDLTADEAKTIPSTATAIIKLAAMLQVAIKTKDDDEEL